MGLDQPFLVQYIRWVQGAIHGDLGLSYATKTSVSAELMRHVGPTAAMAFFSLLVSVALAVPLGICCAIRPSGVLDRVMQVGSFFALSLPSFVVGLGVLWLFVSAFRGFLFWQRMAFGGCCCLAAYCVCRPFLK